MPIAITYATGEKTGYRADQLASEVREFLAETFGVAPDAQAISDWWRAAVTAVRWDDTARRWQGPRPAAVAGSAAGF